MSSFVNSYILLFKEPTPSEIRQPGPVNLKVCFYFKQNLIPTCILSLIMCKPDFISMYSALFDLEI